MKKLVLFIFFGSILLLFTSCILSSLYDKMDKATPDKTSLFGVWIADDGATIQLNNDGTCILQNVQKYTIDPSGFFSKIPMLSFEGYIPPEEEAEAYWNFNGYWCIKPSLSYRNDTLGYMVCLSSNPMCNCHGSRKSHQKCYTLKLQIHNRINILRQKVVTVELYSLIGADPFDCYVFHKKSNL